MTSEGTVVNQEINLSEEYKDFFYREIEYAERLNGKAPTSLTLLTILGTAEIFLWNGMFPLRFEFILCVYYVMCIFSLLLFIFTVYCFIKSYSNYTYAYINIEQIRISIDGAKKIAVQNQLSEEKLNNYITKLFQTQFMDAAIHNRKTNRSKNNAQKKLSTCIILMFILSMICFSFRVSVVDSVYKIEPVYRISIIDSGGDCNV